MWRYAVKRLLVTIPMLLIASFVMFMMVSLSGDPMSRFRDTDPPPPEASIKAMEHDFGLDQPVLLRYFKWLLGLFTGNFGQSMYNVDISHELGARLIITLRLVVLAVVIAAILAIIVGIVSALKQYGKLDMTLSAIIFIAMALPVFWIAILLKQAAVEFNKTVGHTALYTIGDGTSSGVTGFGLFGYILLPIVVLVVNIFASWSRYVRASMIEVLQSDYMRLARAKGLSKAQAVIRHGLRNALLPFVTVVAMDFASLISGAVVTETVFQWRGMGDLLLTAVHNLDVNVIMAWLLLFAALTILLNLLADLLYGLLDPRIRLSA
ncbi:ABC transporter permease [Brevibacterium sp. 91QC2O2]|uniref:ABC transporter permease n=1 Tax=Brevibacterium sp. 91QC2O2 TaxID=2968458 RepID=UPI00211CBD4B|nr:ABC transporter permease [Brevibacterium sp. 91QC2O2]MCQ9368746.1 ABC transporter permease [Brevibacterium sp. 91QC2O2]